MGGVRRCLFNLQTLSFHMQREMDLAGSLDWKLR
jgi:hypothetical protein